LTRYNIHVTLLKQLILKENKKSAFALSTEPPLPSNTMMTSYNILSKYVERRRERDDAARNFTDTDCDKNSFHGSLEAVNKIAAFFLQYIHMIIISVGC
jgi:hypothetical protein